MWLSLICTTHAYDNAIDIFVKEMRCGHLAWLRGKRGGGLQLACRNSNTGWQDRHSGCLACPRHLGSSCIPGLHGEPLGRDRMICSAPERAWSHHVSPRMVAMWRSSKTVLLASFIDGGTEKGLTWDQRKKRWSQGRTPNWVFPLKGCIVRSTRADRAKESLLLQVDSPFYGHS